MKDSRIKAVIFDWAGTTVDFGCMAPTAVFIEAFKEKGIEITVKEAREPMGLKKIDHVRALMNNQRIKKVWEEKYKNKPTEEDVQEIYKKLEPMLIAIVKDYCEPIPGVIDLMKNLHDLGIKVGSTTGYTTPIMDVIKPIAAEKGYKPDSIMNSSEVPEGRPAPWMCFENAKKMGVYPMNHIVKVGDTVADVKEGIMAGMWTVGVVSSGNEVGYNYEDFKNADKKEIKNKMEVASSKLKEAGAHFIIDGVWDLMPILEEIDERIKRNEQPKL